MAFRPKEQNPLSELVELHARVQATDNDDLEVRATLLINPEEIDVGDYTVQVNLMEANLSVDAFGCVVDFRSKYGMRVHPETVKRSVSSERSLQASVSTSIAAEATAEMSFSPIECGLKANARAERTDASSTGVALTERSERSIEHFPVEAVGANRWKVSNEDQRPLRGYYLSDVALCRLSATDDRSNQLGVGLALAVAKKNVEVSIIKDRTIIRPKPNKDRLLALIVAKRLSEVSKSSNDREMTFSVVEVEDEG